MNSEKLSIVFFGSNHLSVACLEKLVMDERFEVLAVASQTDKPAGRGHKLTPTPVSQYAIDHEIALYRCDRPSRDEVLFNALHSMRPDYFVVVAYGAILPQRYLDIPKKLSVNVHGSILPAYRGASPIQTAILDQASITGVTIMQMSMGMDEGDILSTQEILIDEAETTGSLFEKFAIVSPNLLVETIAEYHQGKIERIPQDHARATYTRKFTKEDARWNLEKTMDENLAIMRANTPGAMLWGEIDGKRYKFTKLEKTSAINEEWVLSCSDGGLKVIEAIDNLGKKV
ncbi:MAG: methionyl-tRNA formyltransferase [Candidatus Gracilibacteria bacterium]